MPLSVLLNSQVITSLNDAITASAHAQPGRGEEVGGILLGTVVRRSLDAPVVRVESFEPVESEHRRGSSYVLSDRDKNRVAHRLVWWNKHHKQKLQPVGFYRTHTRRGLYLDNDDFSVLRSYFPEPESVFLLVRLSPGAQRVGGFFFWADGDVHRERSYLEFPFDPERLKLIQQAPEPVTPRRERVGPATVRPPATIPGTPGQRLTIGAAAFIFGVLVFYTAHSIPGRHTIQANSRESAVVVRGLVPDRVAMPASASQPQPSAPIEKPSPSLGPAPPASPRPQFPPPATGLAARGGTDQGSRPEPASPIRPKPKEESPAVTLSLPPPQIAEAMPPPPLPNLVPTRLERKPAPLATVTIEPVGESKLGRLVGHIPGFRRRERKNQAFVPARPIRQIAPAAPPEGELVRDTVDLKVTVDPDGNVADVEPASHGADRQLVRLASDAARRWQFEPARRNDEMVTSQVILHFKFKSPE
jgi:protein TonB